MAGDRLNGLQIIVSSALPIPPRPGEQARRIVRHGLADVLAWLGEQVGPKPDDATHALRAGSSIFVSSSLRDSLRAGEWLA